MRSLARETVYKFIFSRLFNPSDEGLFNVLCSELSPSDKTFAVALLKAVDVGEQKYLAAIEEFAVGYKLNRIFNSDKCALMIGMAELDAFPETDVPIVIDEAVKLAAKYSTEKSTDFVNGILAAYVGRK